MINHLINHNQPFHPDLINLIHMFQVFKIEISLILSFFIASLPNKPLTSIQAGDILPVLATTKDRVLVQLLELTSVPYNNLTGNDVSIRSNPSLESVDFEKSV